MTELDETGAVAAMVQQTLDLGPLATDPRARAFVDGAASRARVRAEEHASSPRFINWFTPGDVLPIILLVANELTSAEAFAAAAGAGFSVLARLETLALCDSLAERMPDAMAAVRRDDDADLILVDAMFAVMSDRFKTGRTVTLIRKLGTDERGDLAPLLVAFLDETARDVDLRMNAYQNAGKPLARPIAQDTALRQLAAWGVAIDREAVDGWCRAGAVSAEVANEVVAARG